MELLYTLFHFIVAIAILVSFHEFGHFWVARRCGVKVLRFSVGFGKVVFSYQKTPDSTEYVLSAIPLGGYVKMVDEREGSVKKEDLPFAFNRKPLAARFAIVAAGPLFNLILAIALYWMVAVIGESGLSPIIGELKPDTLAHQTGFSQGEKIISVNDKKTPTWTKAMTAIFSNAISGEQSINIITHTNTGVEHTRHLIIPEEATMEPSLLYKRLGFVLDTPKFTPIIGTILDDSPASTSGLQEGDLIRQADTVVIKDWMQWVDYVQQRPKKPIKLLIERDGVQLSILITPRAIETHDKIIGQMGAKLFLSERDRDAIYVHYSLPIGEGLVEAAHETYSHASMSLKMMGKMLVGKASTDNLSGPISIAQYAGQSAEMGYIHFLKFLAIVSVSLGVLNLLPIPVLDGGHLLFYVVEAIKGSPVSEKIQIVFQQIGIFLLLLLMLFSVFLDLERFF
ncbi:MAG: RIP metalloprotease RseP [Methylococcales bacterium]|nr:RIP metalloprotease RseP [Methylococcales bacterium]